MTGVEDIFAESLDAVRLVMATLSNTVGSVRALDDDRLLVVQRSIAELRRELDSSAAAVAGEVEYRSRRELGYSGLAQRQGFRTPEKLVQFTTGSTARDAAALVSVGTLIYDTVGPIDEAGHNRSTGDGGPSREPWLRDVGRHVASGALGVDSAHAIKTGLGHPRVPSGSCSDDAVTAEQLSAAALTLLAEAPGLNADALLQRARQLRDELDIAGVAQREQRIYDERSVRRFRRPNGLSRYIIDPDIEAAAFLDDLYDHATSPRRGDVTFHNDDDRAWADSVSRDTRTTDQYAHDTIVGLLRVAVDSDLTATRGFIGSRRPSVRVLTTATSLLSGKGLGRVENVSVPVSIATVHRMACADGMVQVSFTADGSPLDLGREQRLFSRNQRLVLAARDGGCIFPSCDRPPSWTEAHHIDHWQRDHGRTDINRGVLLCRHHHMLVHNNGWEITNDGNGFHLIPPPSLDPAQTPIPMPTKSAALRDLHGERLATQQTRVRSPRERRRKPRVNERTMAEQKTNSPLADVRSAGG